MSIEVFNESRDSYTPSEREAEVLEDSADVGVNEEALVDVASFALKCMDVHPDAELSIHIVDLDTIADLHVRWLDLEGPTDVMSFPMDELAPGSGRPDAPDPGPSMLGDIVLCPDFADRRPGRRATVGPRVGAVDGARLFASAGLRSHHPRRGEGDVFPAE